jgi:hypothetical protein
VKPCCLCSSAQRLCVRRLLMVAQLLHPVSHAVDVKILEASRPIAWQIVSPPGQDSQEAARTLKRPNEPQWAQKRMAGCPILSGSRAERGHERLANFCCERGRTENHAGYSRHLEFSLRAHLSLSAPSFLGRQFHWSRRLCKLPKVPSTAQ